MCHTFFFIWYLCNYSHQDLKERHVLVTLKMFRLLSTTLILLHPWVRVDQAGIPLPLKTLNILVGLTLKLMSLGNHYQATITRCDFLATILFKLVDSYLIAFKFGQYCSINTKEWELKSSGRFRLFLLIF